MNNQILQNLKDAGVDVLQFTEFAKYMSNMMTNDANWNELFFTVGQVLDDMLASNLISLAQIRNPNLLTREQRLFTLQLLGFRWQGATFLTDEVILNLCNTITGYYQRAGAGSVVKNPYNIVQQLTVTISGQQFNIPLPTENNRYVQYKIVGNLGDTAIVTDGVNTFNVAVTSPSTYIVNYTGELWLVTQDISKVELSATDYAFNYYGIEQTQVTAKFISYIINSSIQFESLWTKDYIEFFSRYQIEQVRGERLTWNETIYSGNINGWYLTPHIQASVLDDKFLPIEDYKEIYSLFDYLAPTTMVLNRFIQYIQSEVTPIYWIQAPTVIEGIYGNNYI